MKKWILSIFTIALLSTCQSVEKEKKKRAQLEDFVALERQSNGDYLLYLKDSTGWEVARGSSEELIDWKEAINRESGTLSIAYPYPQKRLIFGLRNSTTHDTLYISERNLSMEGSANFRDLGGIITTQGRQLRWGKIFRSGSLAQLTAEDLELFEHLQIKEVIDFRIPQEIETAPDRYPDSTVKRVVATIGNPADLRKAMGLFATKVPSAHEVDSMMIETYAGFIASLTDFQPLFDALLKDQNPFLFHCTAGKDRTGIAAALILLTLKVDREAIMTDYLLSNQYRQSMQTSNLEKIKAYGISQEVVDILGGVKPEYLNALFEAIDQKYTSTEEMLQTLFGIDEQEQQQIIEHYTI